MREQLKIKYGKAMKKQETSLLASPFSEKPDVDMSQLNRVIEMRLDEITANLKEQIKLRLRRGEPWCWLDHHGRCFSTENLMIT